MFNNCGSNKSSNYSNTSHSYNSYSDSDEVDEEDNEDEDSPLTFHGYTCTDDCSGHQAGYDWAEENSITDSDDCSGNSQSFIEGCQAYIEEY